MAKQEKELTVEERLKHLYNLQLTLSEVDRIKTLRGELPLEVEDLDDEIARLNTRKANFEEELALLKKEIDEQQANLEKAEKLIDKYTKDQDN